MVSLGAYYILEGFAVAGGGLDDSSFDGGSIFMTNAGEIFHYILRAGGVAHDDDLAGFDAAEVGDAFGELAGIL